MSYFFLPRFPLSGPEMSPSLSQPPSSLLAAVALLVNFDHLYLQKLDLFLLSSTLDQITSRFMVKMIREDDRELVLVT